MRQRKPGRDTHHSSPSTLTGAARQFAQQRNAFHIIPQRLLAILSSAGPMARGTDLHVALNNDAPGLRDVLVAARRRLSRSYEPFSARSVLLMMQSSRCRQVCASSCAVSPTVLRSSRC
jgi:hypothetical protein